MHKGLMWFLTNQCNLNCLNCTNFCDDFTKEKFFISLDEVKSDLKILKQLLPDLGTIDLSGGEVILHPQLEEICTLIYSFFPDIGIYIYTNGLALKKLTIKQLEFFDKFNIHFIISIYPRLNYFSYYEFLIKILQKFNIQYTLRNSILFNCHNYFTDISIQKELHRCVCQTENENLVYYLWQNKFYPCHNAVSNFAYLKNKQNYIYITDIQDINEVDKIVDKPLSLCYNCQNSQVFIHPWHETNNLINREVLKKYGYNLFNLYYYDYNKYKHIYYDYDKDYLILLYHPIMKKSFDDYPGLFDKLNLNIKYLNGLLDIYVYIPSNLSLDVLNNYINQIQKQSIFFQCNFYYLKNSNDDNYDTMNELYNKFSPYEQEENHCYYLQSNSYENGYQEFLNHSFLPYKFSLDIIDLNNLKDEKYLEKQYNQLQGI